MFPEIFFNALNVRHGLGVMVLLTLVMLWCPVEAGSSRPPVSIAVKASPQARAKTSVSENLPPVCAPWVSGNMAAFSLPEAFSLTQTSLRHVLLSASEQPLVLAARAKLQETRLRSKSAKNKRVLLFFRYLNPLMLEGSAEGDAASAQAGVHWAEQTALTQAAHAYLKAQSTHDELIEACSAWQAADARLQQAAGLFDLGELSQPAVLQRDIERERVHLNILVAHQQFEVALEAIRILTPQSPPSNVSESAFSAQTWLDANLPSEDDPRLKTLQDAMQWGLDTRADLKEAAARLASLAQLKKSAERKLNKSQAAIFTASERQALARYQALQQSVRLDIASAWLAWQSGRQQATSANHLALTAETISKQLDLSTTAGTVSVLEALAARAEARQAQAAAHRMTVALTATRLDLARQLGILSMPAQTNASSSLPVSRE